MTDTNWRDEEWRDDALCQQVDPELWFPEAGDPGAEAKQVCSLCPVRSDCLEFAVQTGQRAGVMDAQDLAMAVRDLDPREVWGTLALWSERDPLRLFAAVTALAAMVPADRPVRELLAWTESLHNEQEVA